MDRESCFNVLYLWPITWEARYGTLKDKVRCGTLRDKARCGTLREKARCGTLRDKARYGTLRDKETYFRTGNSFRDCNAIVK